MRTTAKVLFAAFAIGLLAMPAWAQDSVSPGVDAAINGFESNTHQSFLGLATDWSSHHLVYSKPAPGSDAEDTVQQNPRYWEQQIRHSLPESEASFANDVPTDDSLANWDSIANKKKKVKNKNNKKNKSSLAGLWEVNLDSAATSGKEMFPATFTASTSPSCANATQPDFVVYNTNVAGGTPATATASNAGTFSTGNNTPSGTFTITNSFTGASLVLTASTTLNTGNNFLVGSNLGTGSATNAASLAAKIVANGASVGATATSSGSDVTVTARFAGTDGNSIALASSLAHFTLNFTALSGGTNAATIMALDNIYITTCASFGTVPAPYWSYNTGGTDHTSPVVSQAGDEVAFVQSVSGVANLVVLQYAPGNGHLGSVALTSNPSYPSCTAPCMISLPFSGGADDTNSSPFVDQGTLYVGDNKGALHKFINIFTGGTPTEVTTGGWPVTVGTATQVLSSPVADLNTQNIFVGDNAGNLRYVKDTGSTTGVCSSGSNGGAIPCLGTTNGVASGPTAIAQGGSVTDGPLLDVTTSKVFWFDSIPGTGSTHLMNILNQTDEAVTSSTDRVITFDTGNTSVRTGSMHAGAFDNNYFSNTGPEAGLLYVCAVNNGGTFFNHPSLYRVGFSAAGLMNTTTNGGPLDMVSATSATQNECSPLTEFLNGSTDYIFGSVQTDGALTGCTGACLYSFTVTPKTFTATVNSLPVNGGTITVGGVVYTWSTTTCSSGNCIVVGASTTTVATNLAAAINSTCSGSSQCFTTTDNTNASATSSSNVATITNLGTGTLTPAQSTGAHFAFSPTSVATSFPTNSTAGMNATGGTSGIVVDNAFGSGGSQVYYTPLSNQACTTVGGTGGCATQASQSGLN